MSLARWLLLAVLAGIIAAFFLFDGASFFSLENMQQKQQAWQAYYAAHPLLTIVIACVIYTACTAFSLPGISVLTLAVGALFGLVKGTLTASFSGAVGVTLGFIMARYLFKDAITKRYATQLEKVNKGMDEEGAFYLLALRLVPVIPYFIIGWCMAQTRLRISVFYWISQLGMLPFTIAYVYMGQSLASLQPGQPVLSPAILWGLLILGLLPLGLRKLVQYLRQR